MFNPLHSSMIQELFEKNFCNQTLIATMKNTDDFHFEGKPLRATAKLTLFTVSKNEWDTKEDTGKSMKNALYVLRYAKRHLFGRSDIKLNSEKIKPIALAIIELRFSECISQPASRPGRQAVVHRHLGKLRLVFR